MPAFRFAWGLGDKVDCWTTQLTNSRPNDQGYMYDIQMYDHE